MAPVVQLALTLWLALGAVAQCPEPSALRDVGGIRVCARLYEDSDVLYDRCCGGGYMDIQSPADVPSIERFWNDRVSSLVVGPRCELTVWNKRNKRGYRRKFRTGVQYRLEEVGKGLFGNWDDSITSYYCVCN
ncbi:syncollin-like [Chiloscyllium plagiosum]|uniref:syncollin-like n=1 Tax=Chiloscyllium plagiosum TaxID=36176 RepID=UPI001CB7C99A|nr:syncollin-like [Chiloscyllium plagiosum]